MATNGRRSWRDTKYSGQGNRAPGTPRPRNHAEDGWCYCDTLRQALASGEISTITTITGPDGNQYPITDQEGARKAKNRAYTCSDVAQVALVMREDGLGLLDLGSGRWAFRFRPEHKDVAKAHVDERIRRGEQLDYSYTKGPKPRDRRRQTKAQQEEAARAEADRRAYHETLRTAPIGGEVMDIRVWSLDQGHREPENAAERQRKDAAIATRLQAQRDAARQARQQQGKPSALDQARDLIAKWTR